MSYKYNVFTKKLDYYTNVSKYTVLTASDIVSNTITPAQSKPGTIIFNDSGGAVDWNIVAEKERYWEIKAGSAHKITIDPADSNVFVLIDGTTLASGNALDSDASDGAYIKLIAKDDTYIYVISQIGAWSDGGAN